MHAGGDRYRHEGHVRGTDEATRAVVLGVVRSALADRDPVVLCCDESTTDAVLGELDTPDEVCTVPNSILAGRTPVALAAYQDLIGRTLPDRGRLVLVTDGGSTDSDWDQWMQTEALLNHTLSELPVHHLCLMDLASAPDQVKVVARQTHTWMRSEDGAEMNPDYRQPGDVLRDLQPAADPDPLESTEPTLVLLDVEDPRVLRRRLNAVLRESALSEDAAQDLVLAIDEVTANAAEHGVPPVDVRLWSSTDRLVCAITDRGSCFDDPLAGYGPAHRGDPALGGMGLWLARRSVDSLTARRDDTGCTVRLVISA
jgi:anti-sigma regulatory factor (Ser/Thr protein kinase)